MSDYKLVPVEPTIEMLAELGFNGDYELAVGHAAICADLEDRYRAMLAAAPAVQGEPFGYVVPRMAARLGKGEMCGISVLDQPEDGHTLPVYLGPQPAEEIGEVVVTKDKMGNIVSVTRQDAEGRVLSVIAESDRCDDDCDAVVIGGHRAAEQQPACVSQSVKSDSQAALSAESERQAPDVPGLTEALRQYQHNDGSGLVFGYDKLLVDQYVAGLVEALEAMLEVRVIEADASYGLACAKAEHALAAHRKQGGEA